MEKSLSTLKFLLLISGLCHYYSGLVTGSDLTKGICADIAVNKPVDFFLVGRNPTARLLITAKPDYLVYELPDDSLRDDTLDISHVVPVPLSRYYHDLFTNEHFKSLDEQSGQVVAFTQGTGHNDNTYLKMLSVDLKLLVTFNMGPQVEPITVTNDFTVPDASQEFVSATDKKPFNTDFYSFYNDTDKGFIRKQYSFDMNPFMNYTLLKYTCKAKKYTMVLRSKSKKCESYQSWTWTSSPKGWCESTVDGNFTFYLFEAKNQMVSIFDQDDYPGNQDDVFSVVRQKSYKEFFVCHAPKNSALIPTTTATQSNITSNRM